MKKLMIFFFVVFSFLAVRAEIYAWPDFDFPDFPDFSLPTSTPTPTPTLPLFKLNPGLYFPLGSSSPTPTPTNTPTLTPTVTVGVSPSLEPTREEKTTATVAPTSTQEVKTTISPTKNPEETKKSSQKDLIYAGVLGVFGLVILAQAWPKIKKFLHDKTA